MSFHNIRIVLQYLTYGSGLFIASLQGVINWNKVTTSKSPTYRLGLGFPVIIASLIVTNVIFLYLLFTIEQEWNLKLSKKQRYWKMRPEADSGIWFSTLLPLTLLLSSLTHIQTSSSIYLITTTLTLGYMASSLIILHKFVNEDKFPSLKFCFFLQLPLSAILSLFLHYAIPLSIWFGFPISVFAQTLFLSVFVKLTSNFHFSFTIGEVLTVAQLLAALISACLLWLLKRVFYLMCIVDSQCDYGTETSQFLLVLALGSGIIAAAVSLQPFFRKTVPFYSLCVAIGFLGIYPAWYFVMNMEPMTWLLYFCLQRIILIGLWVSCVLVAVSIVAWRNFHGLQTTTAVRKYFHAIVILIYLPGAIWDPEMLFLGSGVALFIFLLLEMVRVLDVPPFGQVLNSELKPFLDEKDVGDLIVTHIYLLVGCSLPLWILPSNLVFSLAAVSGTLSLGFGDTAASVGGTMRKVHKLPDSKKSVEGTLCAVIVQLIATIAICIYAQWTVNTLEILHLFLATVLCCGLEAFTNQVDNLVLPLFLYLMFISL